MREDHPPHSALHSSNINNLMANNLVFSIFRSKSYLSESADDELDSMTIKISKMLYNKLRTCLQLLDAVRPETSKLTLWRKTRWAIVKQT